MIGLSLILVYGTTGWFGEDLAQAGIQVIFSVPGIVLATIFVSLPFVVREVTPVLREVGDEQEQAAATLGAVGVADVLADHAAVDPLGHRLRRRAARSRAASASSAPSAWSAARSPARPRR